MNDFIADAVARVSASSLGDLNDQHAGDFQGGVLARDMAQTVREPCVVHGKVRKASDFCFPCGPSSTSVWSTLQPGR